MRTWKPSADQQRADEAQLASLGYRQQLRRALGLFQNFSVGFMYLSPVVGVYALFALLLPVGGPAALVWSIFVVVAGQSLVALTFGEVVSQYPIAGGIYQWARRLVGGRYGWLTAWVYLCALLATIASVGVLADSFFATLFGYESTPVTKWLLAVGLIALAGVINLGGATLLGRVAQIGFWCEILASVGLGLYLLLFNNVAGLSVVANTAHVGPDGSPVPGGLTATLFLGALLFAMWIFYGFEACGDVAEEVVDPSRQVPRAMLMTIAVAAVASLLITVGLLVGVADYPALYASGADPIAVVVDAGFGGNQVLVKITYALIAIAFVSCVMAIQAAASRLLFSFGRDRMIPGGSVLAAVSSRTQAPSVATIVAAVVPIAIATLDVFVAGGRIVYFAIAGIYLSFQLVVLSAILAKARGWRPAGPFELGGAGLVVNFAALAYGVFGIWVLCTKGGAFDPAGNFFDRNLVSVSLLLVVGVGLAYLAIAHPIPAGDVEIAPAAPMSQARGAPAGALDE